MMEQEIKQELANNEEINQIYADWRQEIDNERDSQDSDWSDEDKHGHKDMDVDNDAFYVNRTNNVQHELDKVFDDHNILVERGQVNVEKKAPTYGGTPVHYEQAQTESGMQTGYGQRSTHREQVPANNDDQALRQLLGVRTFKDIHKCITRRRSRAELEQDMNKFEHTSREKRVKKYDSQDETVSCMFEPLNLATQYSRQYQEEKELKYVTLANRANNGNTNSHHALKWPYKTVSERLILNDIFMMLKGLDTVSTNM